ncbi:MAG: DUF6089 family protein [Schleiferiaceae bacterium]|jgi:hypothetical protein|nr:DUF6089 family protein [Schleiferiaceae bacterium]
MKRLILHTIFAFAFPLTMLSQLAEIGVQGGMSNFVGDVGNSFVPSGYNVGLIYRYQFDERYALRFHGMYGEISGYDNQATSDFKKNRNLDFQSSIWEGAALVEFNFFEYVTGSKKKWHTPYIFAGLGFFKFNPTSTYDGQIYELQPLGTEGQGSSLSNTAAYGLWGLNIPFGLGYRISAGDHFSFALEMGFRNTSTDYLDDVSGRYVDPNRLARENGEAAAFFADRSLTATDKTLTMRGDADRNDWYVFTGVTVFVALTPKGERCKRF